MDDLRVLLALAAFLLTLIGFVFARAEKSNNIATSLMQRTHQNEIAIERMRADNAEKYATKHELREAVDDLNKNMNRRFDRLETKLDREKIT